MDYMNRSYVSYSYGNNSSYALPPGVNGSFHEPWRGGGGGPSLIPPAFLRPQPQAFQPPPRAPALMNYSQNNSGLGDYSLFGMDSSFDSSAILNHSLRPEVAELNLDALEFFMEGPMPTPDSAFRTAFLRRRESEKATIRKAARNLFKDTQEYRMPPYYSRPVCIEINSEEEDDPEGVLNVSVGGIEDEEEKGETIEVAGTSPPPDSDSEPEDDQERSPVKEETAPDLSTLSLRDSTEDNDAPSPEQVAPAQDEPPAGPAPSPVTEDTPAVESEPPTPVQESPTEPEEPVETATTEATEAHDAEPSSSDVGREPSLDETDASLNSSVLLRGDEPKKLKKRKKKSKKSKTLFPDPEPIPTVKEDEVKPEPGPIPTEDEPSPLPPSEPEQHCTAPSTSAAVEESVAVTDPSLRRKRISKLRDCFEPVNFRKAKLGSHPPRRRTLRLPGGSFPIPHFSSLTFVSLGLAVPEFLSKPVDVASAPEPIPEPSTSVDTPPEDNPAPVTVPEAKLGVKIVKKKGKKKGKKGPKPVLTTEPPLEPEPTEQGTIPEPDADPPTLAPSQTNVEPAQEEQKMDCGEATSTPEESTPVLQPEASPDTPPEEPKVEEPVVEAKELEEPEKKEDPAETCATTTIPEHPKSPVPNVVQQDVEKDKVPDVSSVPDADIRASETSPEPKPSTPTPDPSQAESKPTTPTTENKYLSLLKTGKKKSKKTAHSLLVAEASKEEQSPEAVPTSPPPEDSVVAPSTPKLPEAMSEPEAPPISEKAVDVPCERSETRVASPPVPSTALEDAPLPPPVVESAPPPSPSSTLPSRGQSKAPKAKPPPSPVFAKPLAPAPVAIAKKSKKRKAAPLPPLPFRSLPFRSFYVSSSRVSAKKPEQEKPVEDPKTVRQNVLAEGMVTPAKTDRPVSAMSSVKNIIARSRMANPNTLARQTPNLKTPAPQKVPILRELVAQTTPARPVAPKKPTESIVKKVLAKTKPAERNSLLETPARPSSQVGAIGEVPVKQVPQTPTRQLREDPSVILPVATRTVQRKGLTVFTVRDIYEDATPRRLSQKWFNLPLIETFLSSMVGKGQLNKVQGGSGFAFPHEAERGGVEPPAKKERPIRAPSRLSVSNRLFKHPTPPTSQSPSPQPPTSQPAADQPAEPPGTILDLQAPDPQPRPELTKPPPLPKEGPETIELQGSVPATPRGKRRVALPHSSAKRRRLADGAPPHLRLRPSRPAPVHAKPKPPQPPKIPLSENTDTVVHRLRDLLAQRAAAREPTLQCRLCKAIIGSNKNQSQNLLASLQHINAHANNDDRVTIWCSACKATRLFTRRGVYHVGECGGEGTTKDGRVALAVACFEPQEKKRRVESEPRLVARAGGWPGAPTPHHPALPHSRTLPPPVKPHPLRTQPPPVRPRPQSRALPHPKGDKHYADWEQFKGFAAAFVKGGLEIQTSLLNNKMGMVKAKKGYHAQCPFCKVKKRSAQANAEKLLADRFREHFVQFLSAPP